MAFFVFPATLPSERMVGVLTVVTHRKKEKKPSKLRKTGAAILFTCDVIR